LANIADKKTSVTDALSQLLQQIDGMQACHKFVGYLQYNMGDPDGLIQYVPFLSDLQNNHYRLTIALTDLAYILSRATVRAFMPIAKYLDECSNNFDAGAHSAKMKEACRESGRKLAIDYFSMPSTLRRTTWYCGRATEKLVIKLGQQTVAKIADCIAQFAAEWKPTSTADAAQTFVTALRKPLNDLLNDRCSQWLMVVRRSLQDMIANKFFETVGGPVDDICGSLDDLCSALPEPLNEYLKPGSLIKYLFTKLVMNAIVFGVKKLALPTEKYIYGTGDETPAEMDEALCRSLRWPPIIRSDDISFDADDDEKTEAGDDATNADEEPGSDE
jgi:hypothetical protein